jgi:hypothetical protein
MALYNEVMPEFARYGAALLGIRSMVSGAMALLPLRATSIFG